METARRADSAASAQAERRRKKTGPDFSSPEVAWIPHLPKDRQMWAYPKLEHEADSKAELTRGLEDVAQAVLVRERQRVLHGSRLARDCTRESARTVERIRRIEPVHDLAPVDSGITA